MSLSTPESVQKLQTALHDKAKGSPKFRFYALYDKVYREDVLAFAYECCKANGGAAGVDGQTFEDIEEYGVKKWLDELTQELTSRTSTATRTAGVDTHAGRKAKAVRSARDQRSRSTDGGSDGARTDFRDRSAAGAICLSARA